MPYDHLASIPKGKTAQATLEVHPIFPPFLHPCLRPCTAISPTPTFLSLSCDVVSRCAWFLLRCLCYGRGQLGRITYDPARISIGLAV